MTVGAGAGAIVGVGIDDARSLKDIMADAGSKDSAWSTKVDAFQRIATFAGIGRRRSEMRSAMRKLVRLLVLAIDGTHRCDAARVPQKSLLAYNMGSKSAKLLRRGERRLRSCRVERRSRRKF